MRIRVLKLFGREIARWEAWEQATVSDVVAAMLAGRRRPDGAPEDPESAACACCGEDFDPREAELNKRFDTIVWESYRGCDDDDEQA